MRRGVILAGASLVIGEGWMFTGLVFREARNEEVPDLAAGLRCGVPRGVLAGVRLLGARVGVLCTSSSKVARLARLLLAWESISCPIGCALSSIIREASAEGICWVSAGMLDLGSFINIIGVTGTTDGATGGGGPIDSEDLSCLFEVFVVGGGGGGGGGGAMSASGIGSGEMDSEELSRGEFDIFESCIVVSLECCGGVFN